VTDDTTSETNDTPPEPQDFAAFEAAQNEPEEKRGDDDTPAPEVNDADTPPAGDEPKPEAKTRNERWPKRVDSLTARVREQERELETLRAKVGTPAPVETAEAPNPDQYEFGEADPQYLKELTRYEVKQVVAEERKAVQAERERGAVQSQLEDGMANIEAKGTEKYTDFEEKITAAVEARGGEPLHPVVSVGLAVSPVGADVAYRLATDTAASDRLEHLASTDMQAAAMAFGELEGEFTDNDDDLKIKDPLDMARMLGRMRARQGKPAATVTPIKTTSAPEPPKERARGGSGTFQADAATTDFAAFERMATRAK
jgi:hypothetical protein